MVKIKSHCVSESIECYSNFIKMYLALGFCLRPLGGKLLALTFPDSFADLLDFRSKWSPKAFQLQ